MSPKEKDIESSASPQAEPETPEVGIVKDVKNADAALDFLRQEGEVRPMTNEDEKKLVRKIDFMIMPLMWCCKLSDCCIGGKVYVEHELIMISSNA